MTIETRPRRPGRPPAKNQARYFWETELHNFLYERLKDFPDLTASGRILPKKLAKMIGKCDYTVYRWLNDNRVTASGARAILELANKDAIRIEKEELTRFVLA